MSQRFHVTGIDISAAQIERARENVPEARFLNEQAVESQLEGERPVFFLWVLARKARLTSTS